MSSQMFCHLLMSQGSVSQCRGLSPWRSAFRADRDVTWGTISDGYLPTPTLEHARLCLNSTGQQARTTEINANSRVGGEWGTASGGMLRVRVEVSWEEQQ